MTGTVRDGLRQIRERAQAVLKASAGLRLDASKRTRLEAALARIETDTMRALSVLDNRRVQPPDDEPQ